MYLLIDLKTKEIIRTETDRFHYDSDKFKLVESSFEKYNGKMFYKNNKIVKQK